MKTNAGLGATLAPFFDNFANLKVAASFARDPGNVWSNPELTCQHVDPEVPLPHNGHAAYELKSLIFNGSLEDVLRKVLAQRNELE